MRINDQFRLPSSASTGHFFDQRSASPLRKGVKPLEQPHYNHQAHPETQQLTPQSPHEPPETNDEQLDYHRSSNRRRESGWENLEYENQLLDECCKRGHFEEEFVWDFGNQRLTK